MRRTTGRCPTPNGPTTRRTPRWWWRRRRASRERPTMPPLRRPGLIALAALWTAGAAARAEEPVKVTVVAVLASDKHTRIDPKLQDLAREVQKKDPTLTGFKVGRVTSLP